MSPRSRAAAALGIALLAVSLIAPGTSAADAKTKRVSVRSSGTEVPKADSQPSPSATGPYIAFQSDSDDLVNSDTNGAPDIFVHDRKTKKTKRVSLKSNGGQAGSSSSGVPGISASGRYVASGYQGDDLVPGDSNGTADVFVRDRRRAKTRRMSVSTAGSGGSQFSWQQVISGDGRSAAFTGSSDLVASDSNGIDDVYRRGLLR